MANLLDYLEWRGDLTFADSAFNEVDALAFHIIKARTIIIVNRGNPSTYLIRTADPGINRKIPTFRVPGNHQLS